jgi:hypothetical protein
MNQYFFIEIKVFLDEKNDDNGFFCEKTHVICHSLFNFKKFQKIKVGKLKNSCLH